MVPQAGAPGSSPLPIVGERWIRSDLVTSVTRCKGTRRFTVDAVRVGFHKDAAWGPKHIAAPFKDGTTLGPGGNGGTGWRLATTAPEETGGTDHRASCAIGDAP